MSYNNDPSPFNSVPVAVWLLFLIMFVIECIFSLGEFGLIGGPGAIGWRLIGITDFGFSGRAFDFMVENGRLLPKQMLRFVTYPFVFDNFTSMLFAGAILLAIGKMVGDLIGGWAVVFCFFFSGICGAVTFGLVTDQAWMVGAYPCVYGLIGAYTFLLWQQLVTTGGQQAQAFTLIGFLMGIQLVFGIFFQIGYLWVAELSGFIAGFGLIAFVVPGGIRRLLSALRRS